MSTVVGAPDGDALCGAIAGADEGDPDGAGVLGDADGAKLGLPVGGNVIHSHVWFAVTQSGTHWWVVTQLHWYPGSPLPLLPLLSSSSVLIRSQIPYSVVSQP